jgi:hypothetical protein
MEKPVPLYKLSMRALKTLSQETKNPIEKKRIDDYITKKALAKKNSNKKTNDKASSGSTTPLDQEQEDFLKTNGVMEDKEGNKEADPVPLMTALQMLRKYYAKKYTSPDETKTPTTQAKNIRELKKTVNNPYITTRILNGDNAERELFPKKVVVNYIQNELGEETIADMKFFY